jgi:hypothetical protein
MWIRTVVVDISTRADCRNPNESTSGAETVRRPRKPGWVGG